MTEQELRQARGKPPKGGRPVKLDLPDHLLKLVRDVNLGEDDPFGAHGTAIVVLRMAGLSAHEIVNRLQLPLDTGTEHVRQVLFRARQAAKLADVGPLLDHMAVPLAVDNLIKGLKDGDKEYTQAVLKGRGAFRNFERTEGDQRVALEIKIDGLDTPDRKSVVEGSIVGTPRPASDTVDADEGA